MKLVSMERETGEALAAPAMPYQPNPYPYGLRLNLTHEELKRLGYEELPPAGTEVRIEAIGVVTRAASEDPDADGDIDYLCVEIQIKELGVEEEGEDGEDDEDEEAEHRRGRAGRMYGEKQSA